jgi:hypothetical protein
MARVFSDDAGTTPATYGGSVARVDDIGPNGRSAVQSNAAQLPLLGRAPLGAAPGGAVDQGSGPAYLRFDGVDDRLVHTFPAGFDGDLLIFGRSGSWVQPGVSVAAGGTLTIGPTAVPGAPTGLLAALGDIVGWLPVGRGTTQAERNKMRDYYMARGARGFLVEGPELVTDPDFEDPSAWSLTSGLSISGGEVIKPNGENNQHASQILSLAPGAIYLGEIVTSFQSGGAAYHRLRWGTNQGSGDFITGPIPGAVGTLRRIRSRPTGGTENRLWVVLTDASGEIRVSRASIKELRPEEDW